MDRILTVSFMIPLFAAAIRMGVPILYGTIGNIVNEKCGVMNVGIEGEMLVGSLIAFLVANKTDNIVLGIIAGGVSGMICACMIGYWTISRLQDQSVVGIMINIFALGFTNFLYRATFGVSTEKAKIGILPEIKIPFVHKIPYIGEVLLTQNSLVYLVIVIAVICWWVLKYTKIGWQIQAVGENPKAAAAAGMQVVQIRYFGYMFSGFMAGVGGSFLTCGIVGTFTENMSAGRGFICLSVTILAKWNPLLAILGAVFFGSIEALQLRLQAMGVALPYQFFVALPYLITLLTLVVFGRNIRAPKALGQAYRRESR